MEINVEVCSPDAARKRNVNQENWKVNKQKVLRYSPKNLPVYPACSHRGKTLNCSLLTMKNIKEFHSAFYSVKTKMSQDTFILKYCSAAPPIRYRPKSGERGKKKLKYKYFVKNQAENRIEVCRAAFLGILGITKHRVEGTFTRFKKQGCDVPQETRGGYRKEEKYRSKIESVVAFIKKFKGLESHYSRKNTCRIYLDSNLSIAKMWRMYQNSVENEFKVKQGLFRSVFVTKFNLSFRAPSTDVCSKCLELNERIKREKNDSEKNTLKIQLNLHKAQAKAFFSLLKFNEPDVYIISFDMQKNLPLPKLPDQSCYYSRQLYCYNLTVVSGVSCGKKALDKENVSIYTWTENDMSKSSNEIASAIFKELQTKLNNGDFDDIHTVRLVADGCGGQNKNTIVLTMCLNWLSCSPQQITRMEIVFPITGHSFMPSDRVFGCIEREIKSKEAVVTLKEYHDCFAGQGIVKKLGTDWDDYDWKAKAKEFVKDTKDLHFKISRIRRLILTKNRSKKCIDVQGEMTYSHETAVALKVNKPGKKLSSIKPNKQIPGSVQVQPAKLKDVQKLLEKHYGANWTEVNELQWYKDIVNKHNPLNNEAEPQENEEGVLCECATNVEDNDEEVLEIVV